MKRVLLAFAVAPLLLAPVRLDNATPGFFQPAVSPAPEAYSLPPAQPLITPTVVYVSPTVYPEALGVSSSSLSLPQGPQPQTQPPVVIQRVYMQPDNTMPENRAALCLRSLLLVQDIAMLSYQQKNTTSTITLASAATAAVTSVVKQKWPNMNAFHKAAKGLPWFYPNKAELSQAVAAAESLCTRQ